MREDSCIHGVHHLGYCPACDDPELDEEQERVIPLLLEHAQLCGADTQILEDAMENRTINLGEYQRIYNSHLQTILKHI